ncbi:MAG: DUF3240 family protein, partial [Thiotrichales bacterium]|nr:DUF3240 family protein [Thiotrichales bacterium]
MANNYLLQLIVDGKVVHEVIDQLLTFETPLKFNVEAINAYHSSQRLNSTSEQVSGHVKRIKIEVLVTEDNYQAVVEHAKQPLTYSEMRYI